MDKVALITGINGQDGSYLTELLLENGYTVHGLVRYSSFSNMSRLDHLDKDNHDESTRLFIHYGDITDSSCLNTLISKIQPDEVYNLAAQSHVKVSFEMPEYTSNVVAMGTLKLLEACRNSSKQIRFYQASSAQMFGDTECIQHEKTPFSCKSPYAVSKLFAHEMAKHYRETYGMYIVCGILFNHTSPRRDDIFVEKKIVKGAIDILYGKQKALYLGNLYSERDIGHAKDYVRAMRLMMIQNIPDDYIISMGTSVTIKSIVNYVFKTVGLELIWTGTGLDEVGWNKGRKIVLIDKEYFRPTDVEKMIGYPSKAYNELGWKPSYTLESILNEMIEHERKKSEESNANYHIKRFKNK
jgi:GDPmannose 4,6-dehydratase